MLVVIWTIFTIANDRFLTAVNLTNLALQIAAVGTISVGVVLVLLLGEIDLSVGAVSGLARRRHRARCRSSTGWGAVPAILAALAVGAAIGLFQGTIATRLGIPSFVVTLAGLLGWQGALLAVLGDDGHGQHHRARRSPTSPGRSSPTSSAGWSRRSASRRSPLATLGRAPPAARRRARGRARRGGRRSASARPRSRILAAVAILNADRGVPLALVILVGFVVLFRLHRRARRSAGTCSPSAATPRRRAARASTSTRVRTIVFVLASTLAAFGGILAASRLLAVNQSSGGSDLLLLAIAGPGHRRRVSLFGGRGTVWAALLGALVIGSISNGMDLLGAPVLGEVHGHRRRAARRGRRSTPSARQRRQAHGRL